MNTEPAESEHWSTIREVWVAHLGAATARSDVDFFEAGGNSLLAASMMGRLSEQFDRPLPMRLLARNPTLAGLSEAVEAALTEGDS
ncbi:phosphopantetheine-binding protein [Saccharothrix deserti]|uniref:phosphopantetheine-binding protein n=1 Tax=Saccharothrix deserti TaxID=2593674 RepID=UPI00131AC1D4|nr:phosphopantetheine-binding protein [Saccharothrix deserti]